MRINIKLEKKHRYLIQSLLASVFILSVSQNPDRFTISVTIFLSLLIVLIGSFIIHYPNINRENILIVTLMPLSILVGALLLLHYYPNLSLSFKMIAVASFGLLYYLTSLMDNIFLVVQDREEAIPLYRVALTWSQILQVTVSIPLFAGVYKLNTAVFTQMIIVVVTVFLFTLYQIKSLRFEDSAKKPEVGESFLLSGISSFLVASSSVAVSFIPTEAFLRALFTASVLMFSFMYVVGHLKNEITVKMLVRYLSIILVFFLILILFIS